MTIGIFIPAFSFTIIGHEFFEAVVDNKLVEPFLDGVGAAVIGKRCLSTVWFYPFTMFIYCNFVLSIAQDSVTMLSSFFGILYNAPK